MKNIRVIDAQGTEYGVTYRRRARGLVKKGRARFIDYDTLMLACPPNLFSSNLEDTVENIISTEANAVNIPAQEATAGLLHLPGKQNVTFTLEPRRWLVEPKRNNWGNKVERVHITDMTGKLTEAICLGDWHKHWSSAESPKVLLKKNTDYAFAFWLNGGENDRMEELCQLRIYLNGDDENPLIYRLNRDYIKAERYHKGWYRYEIPFNTGEGGEFDNGVVTIFQFVAQDAYCAVLPDKPDFAALEDEPRPNPRIPQRHNIKFTDGYPRDSMWSHLVFGEDVHERQSHNQNNNFQNLANMGIDFESVFEHMESSDIADLLRGATPEGLASLGVDIEGLFEHMESEDVKEILSAMIR